MKKNIIGILGGGKWGTVLGNKLAAKSQVKIYSRDLDSLFKEKGGVRYFREMAEMVDSRLIIVAVPVNAIRQVIGYFYPFYSGQPVLGVSKGMEKKTYLLPSQIIQEVLGKRGVIYGHLSGPSFAAEVARELPAGANLGLLKISQRSYFKEIFDLENFLVKTVPDLIGVQLAGALKNIIAIAAGISDGLGMGNNFRAFLIWQGLQEMIAFGKKAGAKPETFWELCGVGDLILTSTSPQSRNYRAGLEMGKRANLKRMKSETIEGIDTVFAAFQLRRQFGLELPVIEGVYQIIYQGKSPKKILNKIREKIIHDAKV